MKYVILDNIRSAHNVGSIFRTADGAGVGHLYLCGVTPTPKDRFGRKVPQMEKTSLGATETVPWSHEEDTLELVKKLKAKGVQIVAVEQTKRSVPWNSISYQTEVAFIFGNEIVGVNKEVCEEADLVVDIKMHGYKESLNVGVSVGVVLFNQ